ncbi:integral membrane protein [Seiridium cupressi]
MADESAREVELESFPLAMRQGLWPERRADAGRLGRITALKIAVRGVSVGIGSKNDRLNTWLQAEAEKFYIAWITIYVVGVALIKSSVCTTLIRIAAEAHRFMRIAVWALLGLTWASFCVAFFGILTFCRPVEANWNTALVAEGKASCADTETLIGISHTNTGTSIATDVGCIVLPGLLLWNTQMRTKDKLRVFGLLSVASVASLTTIARAPFISRYKQPTDNLMYYIGYIVLLSSVETGIGCIAASLPSTRAFYLRVRGLDSSKPASTPNAKSLVTIGGGIVDGNRSVPNRKVFTKSTDRSTTTACVVGGAGDWERLHDDDSDKGILLNGKNRGIRADYSYAVELEPVKTSRPERSD